MPSMKRKSRDLRTEVLESASSDLRAAAQSKRPRLSSVLSEDSRSRESTAFSEADFASTQYEPSGNILQNYTDARDEEPEVDSDEDAELLDEAAKEYMRRKEDQQNVENQAADCGILQSVTCQNFMCHRKLDVDFGPLINFIIGHNGSGKSAVLTAITLCLGGKATSTNRGQSLKSFVREGAETAILTVKIKNQGMAAYKRDLYGDCIVVERHFNIHGGSGFKIKSKDGKSIISTKRTELDEITDFFALQLDNPVNVLTQDQARQFLNNSSNADKYRFFMKGVQLEQLDNDYSVLGEQLDNAEHSLITTKDDCQALKGKYGEAKKKLQRSQKSESVRDKIRKYSRQAAWAQVEGEERGLEQFEEAIEEQQERVRRAQEAFHNTEARFAQAEQVAEEAERGVQELKQDKSPLDESHREAKEKFEAVKKEIADANTTLREIKGTLDSERKRMTETEKAIEAEYQRLSDRSDGRENEKRNEIREKEQTVESNREQQREHDSSLQQLENDHRTAQEKQGSSSTQERRKQAAVSEAQKQLREMQTDSRDQLAAFHQSMRNVLKAIEQDSGFSRKPIGPLAFHVRNKQPNWQNMIEKTFGNQLDNFIVTNRQDQKRLSDLLARLKCPSHVLVANADFRISSLKEPDQRFNTILRVLDIDNELVLNQLVINSSIEQTILVETQDEAIQLSEHGLPNFCKAIMCPHPRQRGRGFRFQQGRSGQRMEPVDPWTKRLRMKTDDEAAIRSQQDTVQALKDELYEAEQHKRECMEAVKSAAQALQQHKRRGQDLRLRGQRTEDRIAELKGELEAMQPQDGALDGLKQQFDEHKEQVEHLKQQLDAATQEKEDTALQNRDNKRVLDQLILQLNGRESAIAEAEKNIEKYRSNRTRALKEKNEADHLRIDCGRDVERAERDRDDQAGRVEEFTRSAAEICARVPVDEGMDYEKIEKKMDMLNKEIDRHDEQAGGNKEQVHLAYLEAKKKLLEAEKQFRMTMDLMHSLTMTLRDRTAVWKHFRDNITVRARLEFASLMKERGFVGKMTINHKKKTLTLDVNPDTKRSRNSEGRQTKTLSGGEKSFSTVCMLLALWEAMGSPIRCLDEFDVFMDSVNRDMSMRLMIQSARQSVGRQFILITPQAMGGVEYGNDVKINRLNDPERGQTTLNLPGA